MSDREGPTMSTADEIEALATKVEALKGPDREVDGLIAKATGMNFGFCGDDGWICAACAMGIDTAQFPGCGCPLGLSDERTSYPNDWREDERLPRYTASLDAAMTLVPKEWVVGEMSWWRDDRLAIAHMDNKNGLSGCSGAETLPLALTAAALRAHAAIIREGED